MTKKYRVYAMVSGTKYLGEVEAADNEEATSKGYDLPNCSVGLCHACSKECDDADITGLYVEEA